MAEGPGGEDEGGDAQLAAQLPAEHLDDGGVAPVAHQEGQLPEAVVGQADADVVEQVVVGVRPQGHRAAEIAVLGAQAHRDNREGQDGEVGLPRLLQRPAQVLHHGLGDDVVGTQGGLVSVLFQGTHGDEDDGVLLVHLFHLQAGQVSVIADHAFASILLATLAAFSRSYSRKPTT